MTVVDPEPPRREKCACRIEVNGLVDLDSEQKIKMCPVHAAAFQMLAALHLAKSHIEELADAWQRGAIQEFDGKGGTRSNRHMDINSTLWKPIALAERKTP